MQPTSSIVLSFTRKKRSGAVYVEALILIPFLLIVWACIYYLIDKHHAQNANASLVRRCAWQYAQQSCEGDVPEECSSIVGEKSESIEDTSGILGALQKIPGGFDKMFGAIFGEGFSANTKTTLKVPNTLGGGTQTLSGKDFGQYLLCNEKKTTLGQVAKDAACDLAKSIDEDMGEVFCL